MSCAYSYDDIGNRIASTEAGVSRTYAANPLNQYVGSDYDLDGNQTNVTTRTGVWAVVYNGENRPVLWTSGTTNIVMKYDHMGRRVEYIECDGSVTNRHQELSLLNRRVFNWYDTVKQELKERWDDSGLHNVMQF